MTSTPTPQTPKTPRTPQLPDLPATLDPDEGNRQDEAVALALERELHGTATVGVDSAV